MNKNIKITVLNQDTGERLDSLIHSKAPELSRAAIQRLIKNGDIKVNSALSKMSHKVKAGEIITGTLPELDELSAIPEEIPINIKYEDKDLLVIDKSAGMVVHPAAGNYTGTLVNALLHHCKDLSGIGGKLRPGIVHRLDKDTSGLMIVAKNDLAHINLSKQLKDKSLTRKYFAIIHGTPPQDEGKIDKMIGRSRTDRKKMAVVKEGGREAITFYKVIERFKSHALLELTLKTGRTHQIRVHLKSIKCPVIGDSVYGKGFAESEQSLGIKIKRQALHSHFLRFIHPRTGKSFEFDSPMPDDMNDVLQILRKK